MSAPPHPNAAPKSHAAHIRSHTGLRGIAALLVVAYHLQFGAGYRFSPEVLLFGRGYLWVDLFFVLSGFIISYTSGADRESPWTMTEAGKFWRARFARVVPLHVFCLVYFVMFWGLVSVAFTLTDHRPPDMWGAESVVAFVRQLFLLDAWNLGPPPRWNIPSWSISAEAVAYLLFPALLFIRGSTRKWAQAILLVQAVTCYVVMDAVAGTLDVTRGLAVWRCIAGFGLGVLIFLNRDLLSRGSAAALSGIQCAAAFLLACTLAGALADVYAIPACVLLVASTWRDRGLLPRVLACRVFQFLGDISYSVYLNHVCLVSILWFFWSRIEARIGLPDPIARGIWLVVAVLAVLRVSAWTYRHVEVPWRLRLLHRAPRSRVGEVPAQGPLATPSQPVQIAEEAFQQPS